MSKQDNCYPDNKTHMSKSYRTAEQLAHDGELLPDCIHYGVCQIKEIPPLAYPEVTQRSPCHTREAACRLILSHNACCLSARLWWQMIPYLEGCCLLLLSNVPATRALVSGAFRGFSRPLCQPSGASFTEQPWAHKAEDAQLSPICAQSVFLRLPFPLQLELFPNRSLHGRVTKRKTTFLFRCHKSLSFVNGFDLIASEGLMKATRVTHRAPCLFDCHTSIKAK